MDGVNRIFHSRVVDSTLKKQFAHSSSRASARYSSIAFTFRLAPPPPHSSTTPATTPSLGRWTGTSRAWRASLACRRRTFTTNWDHVCQCDLYTHNLIPYPTITTVDSWQKFTRSSEIAEKSCDNIATHDTVRTVVQGWEALQFI